MLQWYLILVCQFLKWCILFLSVSFLDAFILRTYLVFNFHIDFSWSGFFFFAVGTRWAFSIRELPFFLLLFPQWFSLQLKLQPFSLFSYWIYCSSWTNSLISYLHFISFHVRISSRPFLGLKENDFQELPFLFLWMLLLYSILLLSHGYNLFSLWEYYW